MFSLFNHFSITVHSTNVISRVNSDGISRKYLTHIKVKYTMHNYILCKYMLKFYDEYKFWTIFYATKLEYVKQNDRSVMIRLIFASVSARSSLIVCWKLDYISKFYFGSLHQVSLIIRTLSIELNNDRVHFFIYFRYFRFYNILRLCLWSYGQFWISTSLQGSNVSRDLGEWFFFLHAQPAVGSCKQKNTRPNPARPYCPI